MKDFALGEYSSIVRLQNDSFYILGSIDGTDADISPKLVNTSVIPINEPVKFLGVVYQLINIVTDQNIYYLGTCAIGLCGLSANKTEISGLVTTLTLF